MGTIGIYFLIVPFYIMDILIELHKRKKEWVYILRGLNCAEQDIEDIIHDMYIKIHNIVKKGTNIIYKDKDVNSWYIYLTLKSIYLNKSIRGNKFSINDCYINNYNEPIEDRLDIEFINEKVIERLDKMSWYNKQIYKLVTDKSIKRVSASTGIPYHSLRNTKLKVEKELRKEIKKWL